MKAILEKKLKNYISHAIKMPYVLQIDFERIAINKEDKDEQYSRWKWAEKQMMKVLNT